jgi:hypothetical protein
MSKSATQPPVAESPLVQLSSHGITASHRKCEAEEFQYKLFWIFFGHRSPLPDGLAIRGVPVIAHSGIFHLEAELAQLEGVSAGRRADFERERDRCERLMAEVLKTTLIGCLGRHRSGYPSMSRRLRPVL